MAWYEQYLRDRYATSELNGIRRVVKLTKGTPQGAVLSPVIWNCNFNDVLILYDPDPVDDNGFADDLALISFGVDRATVVMNLQKAINMATSWGSTCGLSFSHAKTVIMPFTNKRDPTAGLDLLTVNGRPVPYSTEAKYLGITLDCKLNFRSHVTNKCAKATRLLMGLKSALNSVDLPPLRVMKLSLIHI